jgi:acyl carrier protein
VPLGHPIADTAIYVLDANDKPVSDGEHGEIWIGGAGVAEGYLGRDDLTAERFRPDVFAANGTRMYRTGDIGSLRNGVLHFHGRADDQIKLRGFRIELGDVEAAAHEDARVRETAAIVREFGEHDARLVLYVAAAPTDEDIAGELRKRLRDALPPYMRPNHIVVLDTLPHTPNGKIDRKALPMPRVPAPPPRPAGVGDTREQYVAGLWQQMIGVAEIARTDNFFELGGDSLLAVAMMTRVEREMGVRLNMLAIANGTVSTLAATLPRQPPKRAAAGWLSRALNRLRRARAS